MIIVAGSLQIGPLAREDYLASCVDVVRLARIAPGCLDFSISPDLVDETRINVYERWESEEDLQAFRGFGPLGHHRVPVLSAHVQEFRGNFG